MPSPIVISILANAGQANRELSQTASLTQRVGGGFKKMALPAVAAVGAIAAGAKSAIDAASDLQENVSKTGQIFGPQAKEIEKFAARAEQALGQSKTAALDAATNFGTIGQKAGLSGKDTADFSKQFVTLASDLASFNNTSPEEAVTAIGAAMRGESEPIRKYGVLLDDATLRNRALKLGLIDNVKQALTPQQKALAASKEILAQTGKAQGDFARTSSGAANKSRILAAQQENVRAKIGAGLLPAYQQLQTILGTVLGFLSRHQQATKIVALVVAGLAVGVLLVNAAMAVGGAVTAVYTGVTIAWGAAQKAATAASLGTRIGLAALAIQTTATSIATKAAAVAQFLLNAAMTANPIALVIVAIVALVAAFVLAYKNSETFRNIVQGALRAVLSAANVVWSGIKAAFRAGAAAVAAVGRLVRGYIGLYAAAFRLIVSAARSIVSGVKGALGNVASAVKGIPGRIKSALGNVGSMLLDAGRQIIGGLIRGITEKLTALYDKVAGIGSKIKSLKGPLSYDKVMLRPEGQAIIQGLIDGIESKKRALTGTVRAITRDLASTNVNLGTVTGLDGSSALAIAGSGGGSVTYNYTVNVTAPVGSSPAEIGREVDRTLRAFERTQGRRR